MKRRRGDKATFPERALSRLLKNSQVELPLTRHRLIIGDSRNMREVNDDEVQLIITSPPYPMVEIWDELFEKMGCRTYREMLDYLGEVWHECYRVLCNGGYLCINIGDALRRINGAFKLFPNHAEVIKQCEEIGFNVLPYILWKKPMNRPDAFLGSGFLPPNAYVTLDCEYILIFRKGPPRRFKPLDPYRYLSHYSKAERDTWFSQIWDVKGTRQESKDAARRLAAYPYEIPYRLIRMYSVIGDTVLDPFLGTGTTMLAAMKTHRNSIGYEIDASLLPLINKRLQAKLRERDGERLLYEFTYP
ncbi:MAG: site-specific DNA-methyltransferase [Nitrososphaerota archaeon]